MHNNVSRTTDVRGDVSVEGRLELELGLSAGIGPMDER